MALSMDEQRILAEIERRLAADDPGLASCLTTFRRPGPARILRSPRARIIGSLFTVLLVAMVSLMVYAMIPFRAHMARHAPPTSSAPPSTVISAANGSQPSAAQRNSTSTSTSVTSGTSQTATDRSASATAGTIGKPQQAKAKTTSIAMLPTASP